MNRELVMKSATEKADKIKALLKSRDTDISFYGKVQDQYGQNVTAAKIIANITSSSVIPPYFKDMKAISGEVLIALAVFFYTVPVIPGLNFGFCPFCIGRPNVIFHFSIIS